MAQGHLCFSDATGHLRFGQSGHLRYDCGTPCGCGPGVPLPSAMIVSIVQPIQLATSCVNADAGNASAKLLSGPTTVTGTFNLPLVTAASCSYDKPAVASNSSIEFYLGTNCIATANGTTNIGARVSIFGGVLTVRIILNAPLGDGEAEIFRAVGGSCAGVAGLADQNAVYSVVRTGSFYSGVLGLSGVVSVTAVP